nr:MAG TPA_asm: hypothetical protein [Caudoviricetes sp.]
MLDYSEYHARYLYPCIYLVSMRSKFHLNKCVCMYLLNQ